VYQVVLLCCVGYFALIAVQCSAYVFSSRCEQWQGISDHGLCTQCSAVKSFPSPKSMYFNHITRPTSLPTYIPPLYHTHPIRRTWPTPLPRMRHALNAHTTSDTIPLTHTPYVILPAELCSADMRRASADGERVQGRRAYWTGDGAVACVSTGCVCVCVRRGCGCSAA
jgi:hypothetical protein